MYIKLCVCVCVSVNNAVLYNNSVPQSVPLLINCTNYNAVWEVMRHVAVLYSTKNAKSNIVSKFEFSRGDPPLNPRMISHPNTAFY